MSGLYTLGEEYIDSSIKPDVLTSANAGLSLESAPTNAATPRQIQVRELATPTSGFGVSTLTKTLASGFKASAMTTTVTTFGPPWLPIVSAPPPQYLFGDLILEVGCNERFEPVMRPFVLLEPPVAHIGENQLQQSPALEVAAAVSAARAFPTAPPYKAAAALIPADQLVALSTKQEANERGKVPNLAHRTTPEARKSRPHATASVNPPESSSAHSQTHDQVPIHAGLRPEEPTKSLDSTGQPENTDNAFATREPTASVGSPKPVDNLSSSSQTDGRTPGQAFADTFFRGNPFKPDAGKPSQPEQRTSDGGAQTATSPFAAQTDGGNHEAGRGDMSSNGAETSGPSDHDSNPQSGSSQSDQYSGHNEGGAPSSPGQVDTGSANPGRVDTSSKGAETGYTSDQNGDLRSGPSQSDKGSGQDEGRTIGKPGTGLDDQGNDRLEQSDANTNSPEKSNPSDDNAKVPAKPINNPSLPTNLPQPTLQPMVNAGDGHDHPIVTATPTQGLGKEGLTPDHDSPQVSIGAAAEDASVLVSVEIGNILDIGTSKIDLAAPSASQAPLTIGNEIFAPDPLGVKVNDQIIDPGEPGIEIPDPEGSFMPKPLDPAPQDAGVVVSLGSSGILNIGTSRIDLAAPTASHAPLTVGNQILAPDPQGFKVNGRIIKPGGPGITIPPPAESIAANPAVMVPAFLTAAVGSNTVFPSGLAIAGKTIKPGGPQVTISGTGVALDKPGHLIVAGTAVDPTRPDEYDDSGKQQIPADAPGIAIAGKTITAGGPQLTVSGAAISLGPSGVLRVGSSTTTLPNPQNSDKPLEFTFANNEGTPEVLHATPVPVAGSADKQQIPGDGPGIQIAGQTLSPGSPQVTVSGEAVSLGQSGILRIGSLTTTLGGPQQSNGPLAITFAGDDGSAKVLSVTPASRTEVTAGLGVAIAGTTLTPGSPQVTLSGQAISLGESGILRIGSLTSTLGPQDSAGPLRFKVSGDDGTAEALNITPVSLAGPTAVPCIAVAGKTLTPGGEQVTVSGEAVSLGGSGILRIGSLTSTLRPEQSTGPLTFTLPGDDGNVEVLRITPVSVAAPTDEPAIAIAGETLTPGGPQVTISGEAVSLGESGVLRIGNVTTTLGPRMSNQLLGFTFVGDGGTTEVFSVTPISVAAPTGDRGKASGVGGAAEGSADRSVGRASWSCLVLIFLSIMMCI